MRTSVLTLFAALALSAGPAAAQQPPGGKPPDQKPDEFKALVEEVREAYKAPLEVDKDVLDELRKQYRDPTPQREAKIFREIRRLYATTPEQEHVILRELRLAYERRTPEQEERLFAEVRRGGRFPPGTVPPGRQVEHAAHLFRKMDRNRDGLLTADEMTDALRGQVARWDRNRDGAIDGEEYAAYYQDGLKAVSEGVASGQIPVKLPKGATIPPPAPPAEEKRPAGRPKYPPGLPAWFAEYDADEDGQVGLYEWRRQGRPIAEFVPMDRNGDGYLTPAEVLHFLAEQKKADAPPPADGKRPVPAGDRGGPPKR